MELLYDLNLLHLADEHLVGQWRITSRALSQADPGTLLARVTELRLEVPDRLTLFANAPDEQQPGRWQIVRDELLNRPYLALTLAGADPTRALVTRLRQTPAGGTRQLTLYFLSGMELLLEVTGG